jgi:hypothetical protein
MNRLYFGDNLKWLLHRKKFPDANVDHAETASPAREPHALPRLQRAVLISAHSGK